MFIYKQIKNKVELSINSSIIAQEDDWWYIHQIKMQFPDQQKMQAKIAEVKKIYENMIQQKLESKAKELQKDQYKYSQYSKFDSQIITKIRNFVSDFFKKWERSQNQRAETILLSLFKRALSKYFQKYPEDSQKIEYHLALLSLTIQLFNYELKSKFKWDIEEYFEVPSFTMWKACNFLKDFDQEMNHFSRTHLKKIQKKYIAYKLWDNTTNLDYLEVITNKKTDNKIAHILLFQLLSQTATLIQKITKRYNCQLKKKQEIFTIMKVVFRSHKDILFKGHIDTIILCTFFVLSKFSQENVSFRELSEEYQNKWLLEQGGTDKVIYQIDVWDRGEKINIVKFFNEYYVKDLKKSILEFKPPIQQVTTLFSENNNSLTATFSNIINAQEMKKVINQIKVLVCEVPISSKQPLWQELRADIDEMENLLIVDKDFAFSENNLELMRKQLSLIKKNSFPSQFLEKFKRKSANLIQIKEPRRIHLKLTPYLQSELEEGEAITDLKTIAKKVTTKSQSENQSHNQSSQSSKENNPNSINLPFKNSSE